MAILSGWLVSQDPVVVFTKVCSSWRGEKCRIEQLCTTLCNREFSASFHRDLCWKRLEVCRYFSASADVKLCSIVRKEAGGLVHHARYHVIVLKCCSIVAIFSTRLNRVVRRRMIACSFSILAICFIIKNVSQYHFMYNYVRLLLLTLSLRHIFFACLKEVNIWYSACRKTPLWLDMKAA